MTDLEALVGLNLVSDIGSIRFKNLLSHFGAPEDIFKAPMDRLAKVPGIGEKIAQKICSLKTDELNKELDLARKLGLKIVTIRDEDYPKNLKNIYDPPIVLYIKGDLKAEDDLSIAIVGSRRASFYGMSMSEKFSTELVRSGLTIVSGLARGVDSCAHKSALKAGGRTIAVIGSGFNHLYPPEHRSLSEDISRKGAVISEFPINTEPLKQNFPRRNRIISGLSLGVLVIEAARNSGALITSDFALEQGREVFALPGEVGAMNSLGTNALIKDGAKLVENASDIIEELKPVLESRINTFKQKIFPKEELERKTPVIELTEDEDVLYKLISLDKGEFEQIIKLARVSPAKALAMLTLLEVKGLIQQLPGKTFKLAG